MRNPHEYRSNIEQQPATHLVQNDPTVLDFSRIVNEDVQGRRNRAVWIPAPPAPIIK